MTMTWSDVLIVACIGLNSSFVLIFIAKCNSRLVDFLLTARSDAKADSKSLGIVNDRLNRMASQLDRIEGGQPKEDPRTDQLCKLLDTIPEMNEARKIGASRVGLTYEEYRAWMDRDELPEGYVPGIVDPAPLDSGISPARAAWLEDPNGYQGWMDRKDPLISPDPADPRIAKIQAITNRWLSDKNDPDNLQDALGMTDSQMEGWVDRLLDPDYVPPFNPDPLDPRFTKIRAITDQWVNDKNDDHTLQAILGMTDSQMDRWRHGVLDPDYVPPETYEDPPTPAEACT